MGIPIMRLRIAGLFVGTALLAWAAFMYARVVSSEGDQYTQPLVLAISLAPGRITTPEIKTVIDRNYDVVIDLAASRLKDDWMKTDIAWELRDATGVVAYGTSIDKGWENWAETVEQRLGTFTGRAGHVYTLTLQVNPAAAQAYSGNAILRVQIPRGLWGDYGAGIAIQKVESGIVGFIGLLIVGSTLFYLRNRTATSEPEPNS
jgi:hypothetical protein